MSYDVAIGLLAASAYLIGFWLAKCVNQGGFGRRAKIQSSRPAKTHLYIEPRPPRVEMYVGDKDNGE